MVGASLLGKSSHYDENPGFGPGCFAGLSIMHDSNGIQVRLFSPQDSIAELTALLHRAYARLAAMGRAEWPLSSRKTSPAGKQPR